MIRKDPTYKAGDYKLCNSEYKISDSYSGSCIPGLVEKTWGSELVFQNNDKYCLKLLRIEEGTNCSMHFHLKKHETMLVVEGTLAIDFIFNKIKHTKIVNKWESFTISPGFPHSLRSVKGTVHLIEASTTDYASDSIRIS